MLLSLQLSKGVFASGDLDLTFGTGGRVITDVLEANSSVANDVAVQPDGKIVLAGTTRLRSTGERGMVMRLQPDGTLDPTFGIGGVVIPLDYWSDLNSVVIQTDGKIIVGGSRFVLLRLNSDGTLDSSFGNMGIADVQVDEVETIYDLQLQSDGRIVAGGEAGYCFWNGSCYFAFALARLTSDGKLDRSFGKRGKVKLWKGNSQSAYAIAIQQDGKILAAGTFEDTGSIAVARFRPDGILDSSFGGGEIITDLPNSSAANAIAVQNDGKIVIAGTSQIHLDEIWTKAARILRYESNGNLDATFGSNGSVTILRQEPITASDLLLRPDGRILILATEGPDWTIRQYDTSGALDGTFGDDGVVLTDFGQGEDHAGSFVLGANGTVLAVGSAGNPDHEDFAAAQYDASGNPDLLFGNGGMTTAGNVTSSANQRVTDLVLQPDGKIIAGGYEHVPWWGHYPLLIRYEADGSLDPSFGMGGIAIDWIGRREGINSVALQNDGRIVATGGYQDDMFVARYTSNGFLDPTFGAQGISHLQAGCRWCGDELQEVALQPDGKILAIGYGNDQFIATRWNADGILDESFGTAGITRVTVGYGDARALAIQPDGRIVLAGFRRDYWNEICSLVLIRLDSSGDLDATFGGSGIVMTDYPERYYPEIHDLSIANNGTITAVGNISTSTDSDFLLARYLENGALDTGFGTGGIVTTDFFGRDDSASAIQIQTGGKIVLAGLAGKENGWHFALARYEDDGQLDNSFGVGGRILTAFAPRNSAISSLAIQPDEKIVAAGTTQTDYLDGDFALARYNTSPIILSPATLPQPVPGQPYNQTITATGGSPPYTFSVYSGALPPDLSLTPSGNLAGMAAGGSYDFTILATDALSATGTQEYVMRLTLLSDDFEDGTLTWNADPRDWQESGGTLVGTDGLALAKTPWDPSGISACSACTIETSLQTAGGSLNRVALVGWYKNRENRVELIMDEPNQRWILKQYSGGVLVARIKQSAWIEPGVDYPVTMRFDGSEIRVLINGQLSMNLRPVVPPSGNTGFRVRNTTASFQQIEIY